MAGLPKKIDPCPIVESIFEIRFSSSLPEDAIYGVLYSRFKKEYPPFVQLPILQLPAAMRTQDPALRYNPYYKTQVDNFILQIGPRIFSISNVGEYVGWDRFATKINSVYKQVDESGVIENIERIGLRYINILKGVNIFEQSNFVVSLDGDPINKKTNIATDISYDKGVCKLKVTSDAEATIGGQENKPVFGSVVDIDAVVNQGDFDSIAQSIEYAHDIEKKLFYRILSDNFIKTLNPKY